MKAVRKTKRSSTSALLWAVVFFAACQICLNFLLDSWRPDARDPEFQSKLARLRRVLARSPGQPLVLFMGSSRTLFGLQPERVRRRFSSQGPAPVVFNFGLTGYGPPVCELLCLHRLLREHVHPDWVFVEVLPAYLRADDAAERDPLLPLHLSRIDLALVQPWWRSFSSLYRQWCCNRLLPSFFFRFGLMSALAPSWLPDSCPEKKVRRESNALGWLIMPDVSVPELRRKHFHVAESAYVPTLRELRVRPGPDRALRELVALCRSEGIRLALYIMPEGAVFQSWYDPIRRKEVDGYLAALCAAHRVPLLDCRAWLTNEDYYHDSHHLMPRGAALFSERMGKELPRILAGR
jgi:hypothetical protein